MKTLKDVLQLSARYLADRGIERPRRQAEDLLCDALDLTRIQLYMDHDRPLTESELTRCRERLARRAKGEPLAYIHGKTEFYGCTLELTPDVLIPRQETALLVDRLVELLKNRSLDNLVLWDICCGSGCIGLALKKRFPQLTVELSDLSDSAIAVAKRNATLNNLNVTFHQGDLLVPFHGRKAHIIVCNPPYIAESEYTTLDPEVRQFEPKSALVSGPSGLEFYERLARELPAYLHPNGLVALEIGYQQGKALTDLFPGGCVEKDYAGHDRFFLIEFKN